MSLSTVEKRQKSETTVLSINSLINQSSESQQQFVRKLTFCQALRTISNLIKRRLLLHVNEQIAKIVHGLMREDISDEVLTQKQNRYNRPENCDCLTGTKVYHLIWDKLKPDTSYNDIKFQRVQSNHVKGIIPVVSVVQKLVDARDKIPKDALDVPVNKCSHRRHCSDRCRQLRVKYAVQGQYEAQAERRLKSFVFQLSPIHRFLVWK